ncbi:enoyl-CoA hydratase/isomerase family protein [Paraburkholderia xenovorans LB400]|jgi:enoyl-CoA hydratase/carnithine racemase|uniref:Enoyl(3-hydroxyisobutyryl)-coenzyme A hydratase/isomerase n=1 Tax=Paraburkholderia xenovorans (strain LB400) TaxID=266265 RepID=Q13ZL1_PARXL|nr:enoyl-CoA hydratase/isomerase family protein [Paraburkholderia xenovorans]ABE30478.1 Putative enoyl(3-hydroxyisobutyryl)-coenzyme A hydratase/isomerase [Paraburkholderia xenovorans LB400]AIP32814.1 enoyl-CoA hydratase/isomerase family protein [Paraburkholderia xenovorans LB400]NPT35443.1 enoyl-CoA hydratase/isomerase family protein [Paraburkholderia xenovorans]
MSISASPAVSDEVATYVANRIGFIELERPKALNALSTGMIRAIHAALDQWRENPDVLAVVVRSQHPRAFCAGGDVRFLYETAQRGEPDARDTFFIEEYRLNHAIFTYPKPYIALMNGVVMGGGMGISQGAHRTGGLRVVTDSTRMAMPETRIGLFPDVGASWFLARTPGAIGRYLAVTGETIDAADALYAGLADTYIEDAALPALVDTLRSELFERGADVVACIEREALAHQVVPRPEASLLANARALIDRHFALPDVARILASLESERNGEAADWAEQMIAILRERSPLSMAVSLEVVTRAEGSMADVLRCDLDLTRSSFLHGDTIEGIRARIIDKDNAPRWRFARIEDVSAAEVGKMFESPWPASEHPLRDLRG